MLEKSLQVSFCYLHFKDEESKRQSWGECCCHGPKLDSSLSREVSDLRCRRLAWVTGKNGEAKVWAVSKTTLQGQVRLRCCISTNLTHVALIWQCPDHPSVGVLWATEALLASLDIHPGLTDTNPRLQVNEGVSLYPERLSESSIIFHEPQDIISQPFWIHVPKDAFSDHLAPVWQDNKTSPALVSAFYIEEKLKIE